jgi:hypothetical protein
MPAAGDFNVANDVLSVSTTPATDHVFALGTDNPSEKGYNVAPNEARTMWFRMEMPPLSTTVDAQTIRLSVSSN